MVIVAPIPPGQLQVELEPELVEPGVDALEELLEVMFGSSAVGLALELVERVLELILEVLVKEIKEVELEPELDVASTAALWLVVELTDTDVEVVDAVKTRLWLLDAEYGALVAVVGAVGSIDIELVEVLALVDQVPVPVAFFHTPLDEVDVLVPWLLEVESLLLVLALSVSLVEVATLDQEVMTGPTTVDDVTISAEVADTMEEAEELVVT